MPAFHNNNNNFAIARRVLTTTLLLTSAQPPFCVCAGGRDSSEAATATHHNKPDLAEDVSNDETRKLHSFVFGLGMYEVILKWPLPSTRNLVLELSDDIHLI